MTEAGWTSKKPIVAGWYWWRTSQGDTKPWVVKVQRIDMDMMQMWMIGNNEPVIIGDGGEWLGPITPDDRQQGRVAAFKEVEQRFDSMFGATDRRIDSVRDYRVDKFYTRLAQQAQGEKGVGDA